MNYNASSYELQLLNYNYHILILIEVASSTSCVTYVLAYQSFFHTNQLQFCCSSIDWNSKLSARKVSLVFFFGFQKCLFEICETKV